MFSTYILLPSRAYQLNYTDWPRYVAAIILHLALLLNQRLIDRQPISQSRSATIVRQFANCPLQHSPLLERLTGVLEG